METDGVCQEKVVVPLVFPVGGKCSWSDTFLAPRGGGTRRHHGQDLMAPKMTPILAVFDGTAYPRKSATHNTLTLAGDNGWTATYMHINNDTPGTDDGLGSDTYAFASGLQPGCRVRAGQVIAYVGDSGNAENTGPHLHFELYRGEPYAVMNSAPSLRAAPRIRQPLKWKPGIDDQPDLYELRVPFGIYNFAVNKDDIFVEGEVVSVDAESGQFVVSTSAITLVKGGDVKLSVPRRKAVAVSTDSHYHWAETTSAIPTFSDVRVSQKVCVLGMNLGVGSVLPARNIIISETAAAAQR